MNESIRLTSYTYFHMKEMATVRKFTLRDMAITQNREKLSHNENIEVTERFLLIVGSENGGKTSLINQLLQTEKESKEPTSTYLLDYKYGRQSGMTSLVKNVCHAWELGSGTTFVSLLPVIVKSQQPTSVILVLDLTASKMIVHTAETLVNTLRPLLVKSSEDGGTSPRPNVEEDQMHLQQFPTPLVIIGGKYDLFQNFEPTRKRITCQYLRSLAHVLQADLFFYSKSDNKLVKITRDFLLQHAFGSSVSKNTIITDYNKPLSIPAGHDSMSNIEGSPVTSVDHSFSKFKNNLLAHFNEESNQHKPLPEDPSKDTNFLEPVIDNLCTQKKEELRRIREESQNRAAAIKLIRVTKNPKN